MRKRANSFGDCETPGAGIRSGAVCGIRRIIPTPARRGGRSGSRTMRCSRPGPPLLVPREFMQGRLQRWLLCRAGGFSVFREGLDREALKTASQILVEARRPLVVFPEGM